MQVTQWLCEEFCDRNRSSSVFSSYVCSISSFTIHRDIHPTKPLLIILLIGIVDDIEESELVDALGGGDNSEPISQLLLLEELLCPIITVSAFIFFPLSNSKVYRVVLTST
jgi:hypothetical protein